MIRRPRAFRGSLLLLVAAVLALNGCTRTRYRLSADQEATCLVEQKSFDPRWNMDAFTIEMDPRSRYYDPWDRDYPPMPPDDPAAHRYMHYIDGMRGWPSWHMNGDIDQLENPYWVGYLGQYMERAENGAVKLKLEDAVRLSIMHDPDWQSQLETIYLSALDVSTERFKFDVQFYGNSSTTFQNVGDDLPGGNSNTLTLGNGIQVQKEFATAGQLIVGFANTLMFQFSGPNQAFTSSLLNFSFVQPLLQGGGRVIALETLTIAERALLSNLRAMQRYRQGNYTNVAFGELAVTGPQRRGGFFGGTGLTGFSGQGSSGFGGVGDVTGFGRLTNVSATGGGTGSAAGFAGGGVGTVGGFLGLLQEVTQIRNSQETLNAELRTLSLLEANLQAGLIDIAQVDQFRQNIETERAQLLQARNELKTDTDTFKISQLGLPPALEFTLDETFIRPFQFVDPLLSDLQNRMTDAISAFGDLPKDPSIDRLQQAFIDVEPLRVEMIAQFGVIHHDLERLESAVPDRERTMTDVEKKQFAAERLRLTTTLAELENRLKTYSQTLTATREGLTPATRQATADRFVALLVDLSKIAGEAALIQARGRVEKIAVEPVDLDSRDALEIARANRLDWMNNRAALVDTWRLIEFNANSLKSVLNLNANGSFGTTDNRPLGFRGDTGTIAAGVTFNPPLARLVQRNNFRQQLIEYQQARRQLIQFEDGVSRNLRQLLRDQRQLYINLEIQRRAMAISIRRVDQTREVLNKPVPPPTPGTQAAGFGPTSTLNLLTALSDLRNTQNNFISVWISFYVGRMRILRELGVMQIDDNGVWIEESVDNAVRRSAQSDPLPPTVPPEWLKNTDPSASEDSSTSPQTPPPAPGAALPQTLPMTPEPRSGPSPSAPPPPVPPAVGTSHAAMGTERTVIPIPN
jgi:hypothetical protein